MPCIASSPCFFTGAIGFIGKRLVKKRLTRKGSVLYFPMREENCDEVPDLLVYWGTIYRNAPALSPDDAADLTAQAIVYKPERIATRQGVPGEVVHALMPCVAQIRMNASLRMFPNSDAARVQGDKKPVQRKANQLALHQLLRGAPAIALVMQAEAAGRARQARP